MKREVIDQIFNDPTIQKLAVDCQQVYRAIAAEKLVPDFIFSGMADADLAGGMTGEITPEEVVFSLECKIHDLQMALNEVKILRAEYGCLQGTA